MACFHGLWRNEFLGTWQFNASGLKSSKKCRICIYLHSKDSRSCQNPWDEFIEVIVFSVGFHHLLDTCNGKETCCVCWQLLIKTAKNMASVKLLHPHWWRLQRSSWRPSAWSLGQGPIHSTWAQHHWIIGKHDAATSWFSECNPWWKQHKKRWDGHEKPRKGRALHFQ